MGEVSLGRCEQLTAYMQWLEVGSWGIKGPEWQLRQQAI